MSEENSETVVYGLSDDLINVENTEMAKQMYAEAEKTFLHLGDGTILSIEYNHVWEIEVVEKGEGTEIEIIDTVNVDSDQYTDYTQKAKITGTPIYKAVKSSSKELPFKDHEISVQKLVDKYNSLRQARNDMILEGRRNKAEKWHLSAMEIGDLIETETEFSRAMFKDQSIKSYIDVKREATEKETGMEVNKS